MPQGESEHRASLTVDGRGWSCSCGRMNLGYKDLDEAVRALMGHERTAHGAAKQVSLWKMLGGVALVLVAGFGIALGAAMLINKDRATADLVLLVMVVVIGTATIIAMEIALRGEKRRNAQRRAELTAERERRSRGQHWEAAP